MDFVSNQEKQIKEMLQEIGVKEIEELFSAIPKSLRLEKPKMDDGLSEFEGIAHMEKLSEQNSFHHFESYLGAGAYEHHVPAIVSAICSRSEFLTAYTPYQAEVSQGMLQVVFEFQSALCALTGMNVANASMYDGASACAEALLMAMRVQRKKQKVLVSKNLHPSYLGVVKQYLCREGIELVLFSSEELFKHLDDQTAAVLFGYPNFFGEVEDLKEVITGIHEKGALAILSANPMIFGLYATAGELDADIVVGDCQPLGLHLNYGGPYAGYVACKQELVRQMPGRLVGETVDTEGKRGFVLTLQAREQHIRREKATSNICTNQALAALASLVTMMWYGKEGIRELALTNHQRAAYLHEKLSNFKVSKAPFFNEFTIHFGLPAEEVKKIFREHKIEPGVHLGKFYSDREGEFLVAVTETKSKEQLDRYIEVAKKLQGALV